MVKDVTLFLASVLITYVIQDGLFVTVPMMINVPLVGLIVTAALKFRSGLIHNHDTASSEENKEKNLYKQMYAYDNNRVPLAKEMDEDSEYINASYIPRVDKIVMLTNLIKMGTMKCLQYWPEELNGVGKYGRIDVKYVDVEHMFEYNIRTLTIKKGHDAKVVKQLHFTSWPDKGVPDTAWC
ncbi:hypothetical protein DPMN_159866 [Dreissena polymorpha]|uniref:Tyrosine-protein phosphatase domain-containing protein n=1 Tax=Dreissena polymorpha TaxID=45954 RepID=A0A9D4IN87_DREPO|nr:hypothetical protein DPMN_159866 [Dreissena polymorpha]